MKWLCDTNVISEMFKKEPAPQVMDWLAGLNEIFMSVVTVEEIFCGLSHKNAYKQMAWFDDFIERRCHILPITEDIARQCGMLRGRFRQKGVTRSQADSLIAATAIQHQLTLSTRNERDFKECGIPIMNPFL
jgi:predicted nucleic acid-binding protein